LPAAAEEGRATLNAGDAATDQQPEKEYVRENAWRRPNERPANDEIQRLLTMRGDGGEETAGPTEKRPNITTGEQRLATTESLIQSLDCSTAPRDNFYL